MVYKGLTGKHRTPRSNFLLGCILAMIAGAINAGGFFLVMQYTSHMTGIISLAADSVVLGDYVNALLLMGYIACFVLGVQNALITKVSSAIIRTTHITGMTTIQCLSK